jgi:Na+/glutamate symporter
MLLLLYFGEVAVQGGFGTCTAFGAVYGGGTAPPPTSTTDYRKATHQINNGH